MADICKMVVPTIRLFFFSVGIRNPGIAGADFSKRVQEATLAHEMKRGRRTKATSGR